MVQAAFYAMVLNDAAQLGLSCRIDMNSMMSVLRYLNWAVIETWLWRNELRLRRDQIPYLANPPADPAANSDPVEDSGFSDALLTSSGEE